MHRSLLIAVLATSCFRAVMAADEKDPIKSADARQVDDLQNGEPVLGLEKATVDAPLRRAAGMPWVKLSNLKRVKVNQDRLQLQVDYEVTEGELPYLVVVFKSLQGRKTRNIGIGLDKAATLSIDTLGSQVPTEVEAWIEFGAGVLMPSDTVVGYKISHSVTIHDKGQVTHARHWKPEEEQAWIKYQQFHLPPGEAPAGFVIARNQALLSGMPVKFFSRGEWKDGEFLARRGDFLAIRPADESGEKKLLHSFTRDRVAVAMKVLERGRAKPDSFTASVRLLPDSNLPLTDELIPLPETLKLLPGSIVQVPLSSNWVPMCVLGELNDKRVQVRELHDTYGFSRQYHRATLAIEKTALEELQRPDAGDVFAKRNQELTKKWAEQRRTRAHVRDYPATAIPAGQGPLDEKAAVKVGDRFKVFWGNRWFGVVAVAESAEGIVEVRWDDFGTRNEFITRKSLYVALPQPRSTENAEAVVDPKPEQGSYSLTLDSLGSRKFAVVKVVMSITGLDLAEAKDAVEEAPIMLRKSLTEKQAQEFRQQLESAGAKATVAKVD